jgi:hypothetical protein
MTPTAKPPGPPASLRLTQPAARLRLSLALLSLALLSLAPRTWLRWQTQVTGAAASASVGWMRRLRAHPAIAAALAGGRVSASWAREICEWTDRLPEDARDHADQILLAAAAGSAELTDLARLAEEMRRRLAEPDDDGDDGFEDRQLRLQATLGGAGRLDGDLTPRCAESVQAVLDALGKKAGPEDTRTQRQRYHDALEEACRRLIAILCHDGPGWSVWAGQARARARFDVTVSPSKSLRPL